MGHPPRLPVPRVSPVPPSRFDDDAAAARSYEGAEESDSSGLLAYWRLAGRHKGVLILFAFGGALAGLLYTLPQTPIYQARTTIEIQDLNENFLNMKQVTPVAETATTWGVIDVATQIRILQSTSLQERVVAKLKSKQPAAASADTGRLSSWRKALNLAPATSLSSRDQALISAAGGVRVRALGQTRIVEIVCDSIDPEVAADFANTMANEYMDQSLESRWKSTQRTGEWLARQLEDMRIRLEKSEDQLQAYARESGLLFTAEKTSVSEAKLRQLQEELSKAQADRVAKESRLDLANTSPADSLPDVLNDSALRDYQVKLTDLTRQLAEAETTFTAEHFKVKRLQAQIVSLQSAVERERGAILKRIRNDFEEMLHREKMLAANYATQAKLVTEEGAKAIHYNVLKREVDSNRQIYESMLQRVKESSIASALRASNVRVVDPARAAKAPYKPQLQRSVVIGLFGGLICGMLFLVVRERADRSLQEPGDINQYLKIAELGVIPSGGRQIAIPAHESDTADRVEMVTWQRKPSMLAESFRATLTSILFSGRNGDHPRVLVMTSASPSEGKSTAVSNLGIALAEIHRRVLLIDADMRKPRLHNIFNLPNEHGLSDLLREKTSPAGRPWNGIIQESTVPNLFVLTSGPSTSSATHLLYSTHMPELLELVRKEFDMILIDTPPMLQIPDARVLGRLADAVIMVVRSGYTSRDAALAARQRFAEDGTQVLGIILNDWNPKSSANGYYGYHNGYYKRYKDYYTKDSG